MHRFDGVGFVFSAEDNLIGIDLDGCRDPVTGVIDQWAKEIITSIGTYAEVSPSQTGVKLFAITDTAWNTTNKKIIGDDERGKAKAWEVYSQGRYFCVTGARLSGLNDLVTVSTARIAEVLGIEQIEHAIAVSADWAKTPIVERAARYLAKMPPAISGQGGHNALFHAACMMVLGFSLDTEQAFNLLAGEYNPRCQPKWNERELRHKITDADGQPGPRGYMINVSPARYETQRVPTFRPTLPPDPPPESSIRITTLQDATFKYLEQIREQGNNLIETGIPDLDYSIGGGLDTGELIIIGARPSHGKSAIALQMMHHMTRNGMPCVMVSEEMSALALGKRTMQYATNVHQEHWREEMQTLVRHASEHFVNREPAYIIESCGSAAAACEQIESAVEQHGVKVAFIDYCQLLSSKGRTSYEVVTESCKQIARVTKKCNIVTVLLAQLNRGVEARDKFIPTMRDLKDSGQLEQDADVILFGVWPHRLDPKKPAKEYLFFVGKVRNRGVIQSAFKCEFEPSRQMMRDARLIDNNVAYADEEF